MDHRITVFDPSQVFVHQISPTVGAQSGGTKCLVFVANGEMMVQTWGLKKHIQQNTMVSVVKCRFGSSVVSAAIGSQVYGTVSVTAGSQVYATSDRALTCYAPASVAAGNAPVSVSFNAGLTWQDTSANFSYSCTDQSKYIAPNGKF